jgi:hypothetical protein
MHIIVRELRTSRRNVCTNLAVKLPELSAYLEKTYPDESLDVLGRVRLLTETETREFWKYRGPLRWTGKDYDTEETTDEHGVAYIIDEAGQSGFSAMDWAQRTARATRGEECLWYLEQHRKLGDNVYASCNGRMPHGIAKPFRDKARDFTRLRNHYLAKLGIFRGQGKFKRTHFNSEPTPTTEPYDTGEFRLDINGLCNCYDTAAGVGVHGSRADKGTRAKGIPIIWIVPAFMLLGVSFFVAPFLLGKVAVSAFSKKKKEADAAVSSGVLSMMPGQMREAPKRPTPKPMAAAAATPMTSTPAVWVTGYVVKGTRVNVSLSDGRTLTEEDGILAKVDRGGVTLVDGTRIPLRVAVAERSTNQRERDNPTSTPAIQESRPDAPPAAIKHPEAADAETRTSTDSAPTANPLSKGSSTYRPSSPTVIEARPIGRFNAPARKK